MLKEAKAFVSDEIISRDDLTSEKNEPPDYSDLKKGDSIGILYIPRLDREIPIIEGTHEDELAKGVGHFSSTALPGQNDQILLSGHRDTVFRQFGELEHGDEIHVKMKNGTFVYTIYETDIVDANDRTVIRSTAPDEILTLSTCYPFSFVGSAPDRYIIYAK
jgi:sortase A